LRSFKQFEYVSRRAVMLSLNPIFTFSGATATAAAAAAADANVGGVVGEDARYLYCKLPVLFFPFGGDRHQEIKAMEAGAGRRRGYTGGRLTTVL
jgi:hypothetical protein